MSDQPERFSICVRTRTATIDGKDVVFARDEDGNEEWLALLLLAYARKHEVSGGYVDLGVLLAVGDQSKELLLHLVERAIQAVEIPAVEGE